MPSFEERVQRTVKQLQEVPLATMCANIARYRNEWLDQALPARPGYAEMTPREVYELLFFEQMGLKREELPLVEDTPDRATWLSYNPCTLLEACRALGWDTRQVCRSGNEKATQAFVSRINPRLRFHRSYEKIRPYAPYCQEWIVRVDFEAYMRLAIEEARLARAEGDPAHGAVVVLDNQVLGRAHDTTVTAHDPLLHASIQAIRQAVHSQPQGGSDLCGAILFTTGEPCPMCTSLAVWANLTTIVYGLKAEELALLEGPRKTWGFDLNAGEVAAQAPGMLEVIGGVLSDECRSA